MHLENCERMLSLLTASVKNLNKESPVKNAQTAHLNSLVPHRWDAVPRLFTLLRADEYRAHGRPYGGEHERQLCRGDGRRGTRR